MVQVEPAEGNSRDKFLQVGDALGMAQERLGSENDLPLSSASTPREHAGTKTYQRFAELTANLESKLANVSGRRRILHTWRRRA
eukprot:763842-Hanusia_phi.AAC.1